MKTPILGIVACLVLAALAAAEAQDIHIKARFFEVPKGTLCGSGGILEEFGKNTGGTNQAGQLVEILTAENAVATMRMLESQSGFEELAEPEVTTISGRQTGMRATEVVIVTNLVITEGLDSLSDSITPQVERVDIGPLVDVVPNALADGYTIGLKSVASLTEFLGYHSLTNGYGTTNQTVAVNSAGQRIDLPTISPAFAIREARANIKLWDGQTVVLGGMGGMKARFFDGGKWVNTEPDYFRKAKAAEGKPNDQDKELLVFITVTLVDPVGNRIHSDDEVPFSHNSIPPQVGP
jgi:Flp pilus assembly secretin CpaC